MSAVVAVDSSHMTASLSASCSSFSLPSNSICGYLSTMYVAGSWSVAANDIYKTKTQNGKVG